jgi:hypothetical protein
MMLLVVHAILSRGLYLLLLLDECDNSIIPFPYLPWSAACILFLWHYCRSMLWITAQKVAQVLYDFGIGTWGLIFAHVQQPAGPF